jgi:hypothetical protein
VPIDTCLSWTGGGTSELESAIPNSTTVPSGFSICGGILVEGQSQEEFSTVVVESPAPSSLPAGATFINFDDDSAPCLFRDTVRLTDKYVGLGVIFEGPGGNDGGAILNECGNFGVSGHSSPNFLAFNRDATMSDGGVPRTPETMHFNPPVSEVQLLVGSREPGTFTVEAYNQNDVLVDSTQVPIVSSATLVSVSGIGITRVVLEDTSRYFVIDDLAFVPEEDGCETTYDVYFGTDPGMLELIASDLNEPNYCPSELACEMTYFWQVVAENCCGESEAQVWSFTTAVCNQEPNCSSAVPSVGEIWPPNHRWVDVEILDVNDPDGDAVSITITGIMQDEPVVGPGSGKTCPDGDGIGTSVAHVRAERSGLGNGRVYEIRFEARDSKSGICNGTVRVCVPHDRGQGHDCVDDGQLYDSTALELLGADLNHDSIVDLHDFAIFSSYWLTSYELDLLPEKE